MKNYSNFTVRSYHHHYDRILVCLSVVYAFKLPAIAQFLESQLIFLSHRFDTLDCCAARDTIFVHSDFQVTNFFSIKWSRRENIEIEWVFSYCGLCFFLSVQKFESNSILIDLWSLRWNFIVGCANIWPFFICYSVSFFFIK